MKLVKTEKYKGYTIKVYEQKPNVKIPITDEDFEKHFEKNIDNCLGTNAYEVLNKNNEIEYSDKYDMWDIGACIENASQDIDSLTWGNK